jgi:hypothetical protein
MTWNIWRMERASPTIPSNRSELALEQPIPLHQPLALERAADGQHHLIRALERFGQVVVGAEPHRLNHRRNAAVAGHHDDREIRPLRAHQGQQLEPIHLRHAQIGQQEVDARRVLLDGGQRLANRREGEDLVPFGAEQRRQGTE